MKDSTQTSGWRDVPLREILTLEYGKSFPEKKRRPGPYAVYGSNGEIGRAQQYLIEEPTIIVGRKGSAGEINWAEPKSWPIDTTYFVNVTDARVYSLDFIYYLLKWLDPRRFIDTTTKPGLNRDRVYEQIVPIPPLPVQERIVQLLQKADDVCRKRKEAMELVEAILPAHFVNVFGDPGTNPKGLVRKKLRDLCIPTSGGTPSKKNKSYWTDGTIPWVSPEDMKIPEIFSVPDKITETALGNRKLAQDGTVLIVVRGMILAHTVPLALVRSPLVFNQDIKGLVPKNGVSGEFIYWALRCSHERLRDLVDTASHGTRKIDTDRLMEMDLFLGSENEMRAFAEMHKRFFTDQEKRLGGRTETAALVDSLLASAFSGELTAEWEAANVDWIAAKVELQERLPRLILLALIRERATRTEKAAQATVLVTALMKYAFLLQMEGNYHRRFFQFVPYHYGPFTKELYTDLERLQTDGLLTVDNGMDEDKTRISLTDPTKAEAALADLPDDLKEDVAAIIEAYGDLDHRALLKTVYEKYPAYAKKSRLTKKRQAAPKTRQRRKKA